MALKPETIARIQGILDGTIKVDPQPVKPPVPLVGYDEEEAIHMNEPDVQELSGADEIIKALADGGHGDYSAFRREIALDIYSNGHYAGNDTAHFVVGDYDENSTLSDFYVIQEDHYDQHMDDDEDKPEWDDMVAQVMNGYLWIN